MSAKSQPGDGTKHRGDKSGNVSYVSDPSHDVLGVSILKHLRKLRLIVKR